MAWSFTNIQSTGFGGLLGNVDGSNNSVILFPWDLNGNHSFQINIMNGGGSFTPTTQGSGNYVLSRSSSSATEFYFNTAGMAFTNTTSALPTIPIYLLNYNVANVPAGGIPYLMPAASLGGDLIPNQVSGGAGTTGLIPRICTDYLTPIHGSC
jgi:hypothetical protein